MSSSPRRYLCTWSAALALPLLLLALFNLLVDPYGAYRLVAWPDSERSRFAANTRVGKAELLAASGCEVLILGSSRAEMGIDPAHPAWGGQRVYNAALSGSNIGEMADVCRYGLTLPSVQRVALFVDFFAFSENCRYFEADLANSRFNPQRDWLEYHLANLLGIKALNHSLKTLKQHSRRPQLESWIDRGHVRVLRRVLDHRLAFDETIKAFLSDPNLYRGFRYTPARLERFRELVRGCRQRGVQLTVVISPSHALELETIRRAGLWPVLEQWKRDLVAVAAQEHDRATGWSCDVWDFNSYAGYTAESVPAAGSKQRMRWYWEMSHYKEELGNLLLYRIHGLRPPEGMPLKQFGVLLKPQNVERHLARLRGERRRYVAGQAAEVARIDQIALDANWPRLPDALSIARRQPGHELPR